MRTLLVSALGIGAVGGLVGVGVPALAVTHGVAPLAGVLLAFASAGNVVGGLMYGSRRWRRPMGVQLVMAEGAEAGAVVIMWACALTLVFAHPLTLAPALFSTGSSAPR